MALDAFGRLRISENFITFNYYPSLLSANTTLDIDIFVSRQNSGTQSYDTQNFIYIPISGSGTTYSLRTTKQHMIYQPEKSHHISTGEEEGIYANGLLSESFNLAITI